MRQAVSILLIFFLMLQFVLQVGLITYFSINQKQIAVEFCVNKNKPGSCCEGKCYLDKQLSGLEKHQNQDKQAEEQETPVFFIPNNRISCLQLPISKALLSRVGSFLQPGYTTFEKKPPKKIS